MPRRIGLPFAEWPQADCDAWSRAFAASGFFDSRAVASHWRPKTRQQAQYAYGRWLAHLHARYPQALREAPDRRVTMDRVRGYLDELDARVRPMSIAAELQHLLLALGALAPHTDWARLHAWQYAYQKRAQPRDKRSKIIDPRQLLELGLALMDSAEQATRSAERARQFRDGLAIALLVSRPLRRRSFGALELDRSLQFTGGRYVIELNEHDTKAGHRVSFDVPMELTSYVTRYLETYRPLFPGASDTKALWLSSRGGRLGDEALYALVCRRTKDALGFAIHPHLFRDIAVTAIAREAPGSLAIARDLLTHAKFETTHKFYTQARTADAARAHAAALQGLRAGGARKAT